MSKHKQRKTNLTHIADTAEYQMAKHRWERAKWGNQVYAKWVLIDSERVVSTGNTAAEMMSGAPVLNKDNYRSLRAVTPTGWKMNINTLVQAFAR